VSVRECPLVEQSILATTREVETPREFRGNSPGVLIHTR
jgi:hypothetical protein